jgi:hypothetical protein
MSFATEISAVHYADMARRCAEAENHVAVLHERLDVAVRKIMALEAARSEKSRGVRWNYDHGCSPALANAVQEGVIGHFRADYAMTDEQVPLMFPGQAEAIAKDNMIAALLREAEKLIRQDTFRDDRARVTVYRGELIIGALDPRKPNHAR